MHVLLAKRRASIPFPTAECSAFQKLPRERWPPFSHIGGLRTGGYREPLPSPSTKTQSCKSFLRRQRAPLSRNRPEKGGLPFTITESWGQGVSAHQTSRIPSIPLSRIYPKKDGLPFTITEHWGKGVIANLCQVLLPKRTAASPLYEDSSLRFPESTPRRMVSLLPSQGAGGRGLSYT